MDQKSPKGDHWAILMGAEVRVENPRQSLRGAVEDVIAIDKYLNTCSTPIDVTLLMTQPPSTANLPIPSSKYDSPSYNNVIDRLKRVIRCGRSGDYVYIHFSGHGSRNKDGALALVLQGPSPEESKYLYGEIFRSAIDKMVKKGMFVTIVLDCCFSGRVLRTGRLLRSDIRYIEYDPIVDDHSDHSNPFEGGDEDSTRGAAYVLPRGIGHGQQLLDPAGYTILTACDLDEEATEIDIDGVSRRGALSYFLLESLVTLRKRGMQISHQSLHQHLRASFHVRYYHQTPMLYGKNGISFFDGLILNKSMALVSAYKQKQGNIVLDAGEAHGVHVGDEYALYPFTISENPLELRRELCVTAEVIKVLHVTSQLRMCDVSDVTKVEDDSSWKAKILTSLSPHRVQVFLMRSVTNPGVLLNGAQNAPFLSLVAEQYPSQDGERPDHTPERVMFKVGVDDKSMYEIMDVHGVRIAGFPELSANNAGVNQTLLKALEHIATYKFFERLENMNPDSQFESSFSITCNDRVPNYNGFYEIPHGETLSLTFTNLGTVPKHLAVLSFSSCWEILNLIEDSGNGASLTISPKKPGESGEVELPLEMEVPTHMRARGLQQTEDIVRVFITSKPTTFPLMLLPRIDDELRGGQKLMIDRLEALIWGLSGLRGGDAGDWSTRTFLIRTTNDKVTA
ncbi:hypothetical protein BKA67DRAFT_653138 [Truncatella angustata]|uniref:Peptidase C14 caspase domain-containing protein n=1 Tax=Truncatella angustata TaxID=152316 RepID=A0A9P8UXE5_9PEZI|nr:uncharacterized protein BKA67DRAFT_653138 [Truncatella angustata]KAH6659933.1 hypothetical protein BKA67DRAFT_653138 [Truncatella angustata]